MRRGGFLLITDIDSDDVGEAIRALEDVNGIDIDERASRWKSQGWNPPTAGTAITGGSTRSPDECGARVGSYGADKSA